MEIFRKFHRCWRASQEFMLPSKALNFFKSLAFVSAASVILGNASPAQSPTTLYSFCAQQNVACPHGAVPNAGLVEATDGNLYGTTYYAGVHGGSGNDGDSGGTVFKITPGGLLTTLYSFCAQRDCSDGMLPTAPLAQATSGELYGTTYGGGNYGYGTVFRISPTGKLSPLHSFCTQSGCADGLYPYAGLTLATNGFFYGTTSGGGNTNSGGTVFKISSSGVLTTLYSFCTQFGCPDGNYPVAGLIEAANGYLYGTTVNGGAFGGGTVFKITPAGALTTLYSFCTQTGCADGEAPFGSLVQASNGELYGATAEGGAHNGGTIFKITPAGQLSTLYNFCGQSACLDGKFPSTALVQATDGNLYGTTSQGGNTMYQSGTLFRITLDGTFTSLYSFCNPSVPCDDFAPNALMQATNGSLFGTTAGGGAFDQGAVISLSIGQAPFVETHPTSGKAGAVVKIVGSSLTGATKVAFDGKEATFTVISASEISTSVPAGAITGPVSVTVGTGTLVSNVPFSVTR